jgi:hypothetical protein
MRARVHLMRFQSKRNMLVSTCEIGLIWLLYFSLQQDNAAHV